MAKSKRSTTKKPSRTQPTPTEITQLMGQFLGAYLAKIAPAPFADPQLEVLTRSQRLRMTDLAVRTGISPTKYIRRAVENFLQDELPIRMFSTRN